MHHFCYLCLVFVMLSRPFIALWSPAGKGLASFLSFVMLIVFLSSLSHVYPGSGVVPDCIDS